MLRHEPLTPAAPPARVGEPLRVFDMEASKRIEGGLDHRRIAAGAGLLEHLLEERAQQRVGLPVEECAQRRDPLGSDPPQRDEARAPRAASGVWQTAAGLDMPDVTE